MRVSVLTDQQAQFLREEKESLVRMQLKAALPISLPPFDEQRRIVAYLGGEL